MNLETLSDNLEYLLLPADDADVQQVKEIKHMTTKPSQDSPNAEVKSIQQRK